MIGKMFEFEWCRVEEYHKLPTYKTPFPLINKALGSGVTTQNLIVLTGETGIGKSVIALQLLVNFWSSTQLPTYLYSGEMHSAVVIEEVYRQLKVSTPKLPNFFGRTEGGVEEIEKDLEKVKPNFILVDNLMCLACGFGDANTLQSVAVNRCREWAIEYDAVVILVAHASKGNRDLNNKLTLNSICGTSNISNFASLVLALNRLDDGTRTLEVLKNRKTGELCEVVLAFDKERKIYLQVQGGI